MNDLLVQTVKGYELREQIGSGGYGTVFRAYQPLVERDVAIKIIHPSFVNHPDFIRRFEAEAQLVARLEHPHIVPLYDYWRDADGAFLVMRWLRAGSLKARLAGSPLPVDETLRLLDQIGPALTVAHRRAVIHRDIKPDNILLDEDGNAYLADFGIAKNLGGTSASQTKAEVVGSPEYLSPEQIEHGPITPQTDIYGLGILLYETLTGEVPFPGLDLLPLLYKHVHEPIPSLRERRPDLPGALDDVLQRATAKRAADRYPDVLSMVRDVRRAITWSKAVRMAESELAERTAPYLSPNGSRRYATLQFADPGLVDIAPPPIENPYKGLRAFQEADSADFFGREALASRLVSRMQQPGTASRFLAVVGPSGSGKSSVVRAGLVPALRKEALPGSHRWYIVEMFPGAHPMAELANTLLRVAVNPPGNLEAMLAQNIDGLSRSIAQVLPGGAKNELVLVVDQFEELWTRVEDEAERLHFLRSLDAAVRDPGSRIRVVVTLRADFYDRPLVYPGFSDLIRRRTEVIVPLSPDELRDAISCPAERIGLRIDPTLVAAIMHDVGDQPAMLPLLQYALTEVFAARNSQGLTLDAYQAAGGVAGALARRAEEIYALLDAPQREAAQQLFLRLITPGEGAEDTRRRVRQSELAAVAGDLRTLHAVLDRYGSYRLLTIDRDPITREPTVEVAHEALIRSWDRLRQWIAGSRDDLRLQRRLEAAASEWRAAGRDPGFLATGSRLAQFDEWSAGTSVALNEDEQTYLDASRNAHAAQAEREAIRVAHEAELERRSKNVLRILAAVSTVAALVAFGLSGTSYTLWQRADTLATDLKKNAVQLAASLATLENQALLLTEQAKELRQALRDAQDARESAESEARRAQGLALINGARSLLERNQIDQARALILAGTHSEFASPEMDVVLSHIGYLPGTKNILRGHTKTINAVAMSSDGKLILSGSTDRTLKLWDAATGALLQTLDQNRLDATTHYQRHVGHTAPVKTVAFSRDGGFAVSGDDDGNVLLWNLRTGSVARSFVGHTDQINVVAISPDGQTIVSGSEDGTAIVWDRATGEQRRVFTGHTQSVEAVAFSPDGTTIASGSGDQLAMIWDLATGAVLHTFARHEETIGSVVFSPDGTRLLTGSDDQRVIMWSIAADAIEREFVGHQTKVFGVAFSPNGQRVAAVGLDNLVRIWSVDSGQLIGAGLAGHGGGITSLVWSPDGQTIVTGARDSTVRIWSAEHGARERCFSIDTPCDSGGQGVSFSPDGTYALTAVGSPANVARLWDVATGKLIRTLANQNGGIMTAIFSPDGQRIATASQDGTVVVQDLLTGDHQLVLAGHAPKKEVHGAAFSPDGKQLLTASDDSTLILWDLATGEKIGAPFKGHTGAVRVVEFTPDGKHAISGARDQKLMLWDVAAHKALRTYSGHTSNVLDLSISPDGQHFLSSSDDNQILVWDVAAAAPRKVITEHSAGVRGVAYSRDGNMFVSASEDRSMIVWNAKTLEPIRIFAGLSGKVLDAKISPDLQSVLAVTNDQSTHLWRIESATEMRDWVPSHRYMPQLSCDVLSGYKLPGGDTCGEQLNAAGGESAR